MTKSTGRLGAEGNPIHEDVGLESSQDVNKSTVCLIYTSVGPLIKRCGFIKRLQREGVIKLVYKEIVQNFHHQLTVPQHFDSVFRSPLSHRFLVVIGECAGGL